jgi:hypothetical protein
MEWQGVSRARWTDTLVLKFERKYGRGKGKAGCCRLAALKFEVISALPRLSSAASKLAVHQRDPA